MYADKTGAGTWPAPPAFDPEQAERERLQAMTPDEFWRESARYDLDAFCVMVFNGTVEDALKASDAMGADQRHEMLIDLLRAVTQEVFDRLVVDGTDPGECVAAAVAVARDIAVESKGWKPRRKSIPSRVRTLVYRRDGYACVDCREDDVTKLSVDHRIAVAVGGTNDPENLITRCRDCNSSKGATVR